MSSATTAVVGPHTHRLSLPLPPPPSHLLLETELEGLVHLHPLRFLRKLLFVYRQSRRLAQQVGL